jgi:hypothetical protein
MPHIRQQALAGLDWLPVLILLPGVTLAPYMMVVGSSAGSAAGGMQFIEENGG